MIHELYHHSMQDLRRLQAENERLRAALADLVDTVEDEGDWPVEVAAARAALARKDTPR
jgi:hypothetical protein